MDTMAFVLGIAIGMLITSFCTLMVITKSVLNMLFKKDLEEE